MVKSVRNQSIEYDKKKLNQYKMYTINYIDLIFTVSWERLNLTDYKHFVDVKEELENFVLFLKARNKKKRKDSLFLND